MNEVSRRYRCGATEKWEAGSDGKEDACGELVWRGIRRRRGRLMQHWVRYPGPFSVVIYGAVNGRLRFLKK